MNFTFTLNSDITFYKYSDYEIKQIGEKAYIFPKDDAKPLTNKINENIIEIIIQLLEVVKSVHSQEGNEQDLLLNFTKQHGLFGFLADLPVNPLFIFDKESILKDNIFIEESYLKLGVIPYIRKFMPNLLNQDILDKINDCHENLKTNRVSNEFKEIFNMSFIYSYDYGEPIEMMLDYAKTLYEDLLKIQNSKKSKLVLNSVQTNFKISNRKLLLECNTLKNAIDVCFIAEEMAEFRKLKLCKYCHKPFMANNAKSEYDSIKCKNKENVYKFRAKNK